MTIAVLGFQLMIFISMFIAILLGRGWLKAATVFWVLFTLFGSIYTMGLMGAIRELARQDWHVYRVLRDTTPYWYTPNLGYTTAMTGVVTVLFFAFMAFVFWIGFKTGGAKAT